MRRLSIYTTAIIGSLALLLVTVRVVGGLMPTPTVTTIAAGQCDQPCWNGIRPGETTIAQASELFSANPMLSANPGSAQFDNERCWDMAATSPLSAWRACTVYWYASDNKISLLRLTPPQGKFQLGDVLALFGDPLASTLCWWDARLPNMPSQFLRARLYFKNNIEVWAYSLRQPTSFLFDPGMVVYTVNYHYTQADLPFLPDAPLWHGFKRYARQVGC